MTEPFLPGQTVAAGRLEILRDPPRVAVLATTSQAVPDGILAPTYLDCDSEIWDTDGMHDTVINNSRLTAVTEGNYLVHSTLAFDAGSGSGVLWLRANGLGDGDSLSGPGTITAFVGLLLSVVQPFELAVGDYVEVGASHNVGSSHDVQVRSFGAIQLGGS